MWKEYPEVQDAIAMIEHVIDILERNGNRASETMHDHLKTIRTSPVAVAKEGFYRIGKMCHPKYLGDVFLKDLSIEKWQQELEKLENSCATAFNRIESNLDKLRKEEN